MTDTQPCNRIDQIRPDAPKLAHLGAYPVGVRTLHLRHDGQIDILNTRSLPPPRYSRPLTVELWYPAALGTVPGGQYHTLIRDGVTETTLHGQACRDAAHLDGRFPLVIISHGYPGNRLLLSHLAENLASKGYIVASIDHTDSTYADKAAFGSTLVNRPLDQRFVIDFLASDNSPVQALVDAENCAVIGYSMGGYGALVFAGAGVSPAAVAMEGSAPEGLLSCHLEGSASHGALMDARVKCFVPIGPWGAQRDIWTAAGLAAIKRPLLIIGGSRDDTSGYETGIRRIFEQTTGCSRHLLSFQAAGHNAAAPYPAPLESWQPSPHLDFVPFHHYGDAIWDTVRMNNITQHFVTAFLGRHLKQDTAMARHLALENAVPDGADWSGFPAGSTLGLQFESRSAGE